MRYLTLLLCISSLLLSSSTVFEVELRSQFEVNQHITFYSVPLICGAAPEIGCGSRLKPLFIDFADVQHIKESWSNRQGTIIAIVWNEPLPSNAQCEKLVKPVFKKNVVDAKLITDESIVAALTTDFQNSNTWYEGMDVDKLSLEEAGIIAESLTSFAHNEGIINDQETAAIKNEFEEYFKQELVKVRTYEELKSEATQQEWRNHGYQIYVSHIGKERADQVSALYHSIQDESTEVKTPGKTCCDKKMKKGCCNKS